MKATYFLVLCLVGVLTSCSSVDGNAREEERLEYVPGEVIITFVGIISEETAQRIITEEFEFELPDFYPARPNLAARGLVRAIPVGEEKLWAERLAEHVLIERAGLNILFRTN